MFVDMQAAFKTTVKEVNDDDENNANNENQDDTHKNGLGDSSAGMAENTRANKSLCDIPFCVTLELMKSLDTDRGWEKVAAEAGFTFDQMQNLHRRHNQHDGSATRDLLWELGCQNCTVLNLYDKLRSARRLREMQILEDYVKGGQESKTATVEKKVLESSLFMSLPYSLIQSKSADQKPQGRPESEFSMSGSEINFNHPFVDKSKAKVAESKNYGDKKIPGPESSCGVLSESDWSPKEPKADPNSTRSLPSSHNQIPLPAFLRSQEKDTSYKSVTQSSFPSINKRPDERPILGNFPEMLSGHGYTPSSVNKNMSSQSNGQISGQSSSLINKQELSSSNPSSQSENNDSNKACFSSRELYNATDGFHVSRIIGEGAFGKVYHGTIHHWDCAIKRLHSSTPDDRKKLDQVKSELSILFMYRQENIVTLYGYAETETELFLVYQYLSGGSLEDRLLCKNNTPPISWERRLNILLGASKGLNFLHTLREKPLIHGDIKSANILLDQYLEAKLGDLGQAKYASSQSADSTGFTHITVAESSTKIFGTKAYMPVELRITGQQSTKSDIYSLGVVLLELVSGLQAYDQSRSPDHTFLADYFNQDICEKDEHLWKANFQDQTLTEVPEDIFLEVLKLAAKCVNQVKAKRPDAIKLLSEVKDIYKRNQEKIRDEGNSDSLTTSMQVDSRYTTPSFYASTDNGSRHGIQGNYPSLQTYDSAQQQNIRLKQQQILDEFHSIKVSNPQPHHPPPLKDFPFQQKTEHCTDLCSPVTAENTIELRSHPYSGSPLQSFPPNAPIPEAFRLQAAYDCQPERKKIDRLSGLSQKEQPLMDEYISDPHKLQKIDEFEMKHQKSFTNQGTVIEPANQLQDHFPQADPKKLAQLNAFDQGNFDRNSPSEDNSAGLECDPVKMAFLNSFDDALYKKTPKNGYSGTEHTTAPEAVQEFNEEQNLTQISTEQQLPDIQREQPSNPVMTYYSRQNYKHLFQGPLDNGSQELNTNAQQDFEFQNFTSGHSGNLQLSDNGNIDNSGWTGNQNVTKIAEETCTHNDDKPVKKKMNIFFTRYSELKNNDDDDGGSSI